MLYDVYNSERQKMYAFDLFDVIVATGHMKLN